MKGRYLCERWRAQLHTAYGNATELPVSQHAEANLTLRLEGMGPEQRRELSTAWLALPGVVAGETGARARLSLFWNESFAEFKRLNAAVTSAQSAYQRSVLSATALIQNHNFTFSPRRRQTPECHRVSRLGRVQR